MKNQALVIAVGAGHLPGKRGVISLLRNAGYNVEPIPNDMRKKTAQNEL
ncbi:MAG: TraB/GumN family protein [Bacteroidota bacterium]|nr:TraB/GumN family protein [Bacteroidota bacterium]